MKFKLSKNHIQCKQLFLRNLEFVKSSLNLHTLFSIFKGGGSAQLP
jgi:hypothetical protein